MWNDEKWFVLSCNSNFIVTNVLAVKNVEIGIQENDKLSKIVLSDNLSKFLDFTINLKRENVIFGNEICILDIHHSITMLNFGGIKYNDKYIITAYSNYLGFYEELIKLNNDQLNLLREKMKYSLNNNINYTKFTELNNEIINMQRELSKKNAYILELLNKKEEMNKELEMLNSTKDRIFSIIGHDLRSPLANIIEILDLIDSDTITYEELKKENFFNQLKDSAENSMLLLENLLEWSKSRLGKVTFLPNVFILEESIKSVLTVLRGVANKKIINIIEDFCSTTHVFADRRMVEVILRNIISNAIKFTNEYGEVKIKIIVDKENAIVKIIDDGIGIPKEKLESIFDLKTNKVVLGTKGEKGTGFGLELCKNLVEQNGGTISISSDIGKGTMVIFSVPLGKFNVSEKL